MILCGNGNKAFIYSWGYAASIGGSGSFGSYVDKDTSLRWHQAVEDRLNGISYVDLMIRALTK